MRKDLLILAVSLAVLGLPNTVAAKKVFDVTLVACSTPGLPVCFAGGGNLTLQKGEVQVDDDGAVKLSIEGIVGTTALELHAPYTLGLLFFRLDTTSGGVPAISLVGTFTTDEEGDFSGAVGSIAGPTLGFFVINSQGIDHSFLDFQLGVRQQFVTAIPPPTVP
jgi:hypothetical protein